MFILIAATAFVGWLTHNIAAVSVAAGVAVGMLVRDNMRHPRHAAGDDRMGRGA